MPVKLTWFILRLILAGSGPLSSKEKGTRMAVMYDSVSTPPISVPTVHLIPRDQAFGPKSHSLA